MHHKILIVEDNWAIRENTIELLELSHYTVLAASDGQEGLQTALEQTPDLILCDIRMPVMDGYLFLEHIKHDVRFANTKFIFFSASTEKKEIENGLKMGADDYIVKPFSGEDLLLKIKTCLEQSNRTLSS